MIGNYFLLKIGSKIAITNTDSREMKNTTLAIVLNPISVNPKIADKIVITKNILIHFDIIARCI